MAYSPRQVGFTRFILFSSCWSSSCPCAPTTHNNHKRSDALVVVFVVTCFIHLSCSRYSDSDCGSHIKEVLPVCWRYGTYPRLWFRWSVSHPSPSAGQPACKMQYNCGFLHTTTLLLPYFFTSNYDNDLQVGVSRSQTRILCHYRAYLLLYGQRQHEAPRSVRSVLILVYVLIINQ